MYRFRLSRTVSAYSQKPDNETIKKKFVFNELEYTIDSFIDDVKKGYAFAYCFKFNRPFKTTDKRNNTFSSTKIIAFDIDHNPIPMNEHIEQSYEAVILDIFDKKAHIMILELAFETDMSLKTNRTVNEHIFVRVQSLSIPFQQCVCVEV